MGLKCRGLCKNNEEFFAYKRLSWDKGSRCSVCSDGPETKEVWVRKPTHIPIDFHIASTNEDNHEHYYDIKGKQVDVLVLMPVKQLAWNTRDEEGTFIKMINEIVNKVECPCCKSVCRAGPIKKTPAKKHYETSPQGPKRGRRSRPDVYKDQVNYWVERIRQTENTSNRVTLDDVEPRHLQSRVKKRLDKQNEGKKDSNVT